MRSLQELEAAAGRYTIVHLVKKLGMSYPDRSLACGKLKTPGTTAVSSYFFESPLVPDHRWCTACLAARGETSP